MAVRKIVRESNDVLYKISNEVTSFDESLNKLLVDLKDTLKSSGGVGLAAPQIGVLKRVVIIDLNDGKTFDLINPKILKQDGSQEEIEGCLSCPGEFGITRRPMNVLVEAQDPLGNKVTYNGSELLARAFCHEIDHLNGILFKKHVIHMLTEEDLEILEETG